MIPGNLKWASVQTVRRQYVYELPYRSTVRRVQSDHANAIDFLLWANM
jgi:hypothetical protein